MLDIKISVTYSSQAATLLAFTYVSRVYLHCIY